MLGICFVISNRVRAGWESGDWLKVMSKVYTYSASEPSEMMNLEFPDIWEPSWRWLAGKVEDMYDGTLPDTITCTPSLESMAAVVPGCERNPANQSKPSFFYANLNMPIRDWFVNKIIRCPAEHPQTVTIPPLAFYN
jgi:hypothetical protein